MSDDVEQSGAGTYNGGVGAQLVGQVRGLFVRDNAHLVPPRRGVGRQDPSRRPYAVSMFERLTDHWRRVTAEQEAAVAAGTCSAAGCSYGIGGINEAGLGLG
jgi:hypothetical protein